jgi:hypothetical protein
VLCLQGDVVLSTLCLFNVEYVIFNAIYRVAFCRAVLLTVNIQKVIFNPHTSQTYEEVLVDIKNMLNIQFPPVTALFTAAPPYTKVSQSCKINCELYYNEHHSDLYV